MAFTPEGERLIGDGAKNQLTTNPENTVFDAKRLIGREWDEKSVQHDIKYFPFKVIELNKKPHFQVSVKDGEQKTFATEEISAMVLRKMKVRRAFVGNKSFNFILDKLRYVDIMETLQVNVRRGSGLICRCYVGKLNYSIRLTH